jgi:hypothetical protein
MTTTLPPFKVELVPPHDPSETVTGTYEQVRDEVDYFSRVMLGNAQTFIVRVLSAPTAYCEQCGDKFGLRIDRSKKIVCVACGLPVEYKE